ncbi:MAG: DCC1-like thiol-disulfide oxidoreductase family protein [Gemmatimonadota bacterium]
MERPILFFDGGCGLCDGSVRWCLRHDRHRRLAYAPLQGSTYADRFPGRVGSPRETVVLTEEGRVLTESEGVLRVLELIGGPWTCLASLGRLAPRPWRDAAYRLVARHRKEWFGGVEQCRLGESAGDDRLLD